MDCNLDVRFFKPLRANMGIIHKILQNGILHLTTTIPHLTTLIANDTKNNRVKFQKQVTYIVITKQNSECFRVLKVLALYTGCICRKSLLYATSFSHIIFTVTGIMKKKKKTGFRELQEIAVTKIYVLPIPCLLFQICHPFLKVQK